MLLRRIGSKKRIASKIYKYFPEHDIYIEPFFGAGGMFFNKPKAKHNILNDIDEEVYNLFNVIIDYPDDFIKIFELIPYHNKIFQEWKDKQENDNVLRAVRFVYLSNFSLYGGMSTLCIKVDNVKKLAIENFHRTVDFLKDCSLKFDNKDFRKFIKNTSLSNNQRNKAFIYADPPYLGTGDNYSDSFTEQDVIDLFNILQEKGCKFAISEFDNDFIIDQATKRNLNIIEIVERRTLKNRRTEILITNY